MKRVILTLLMLALIYTSHAQDDKTSTDSSPNNWHFAIKGGLNYSTRAGIDAPGGGYLTDFHIGSIIEIPTALDFKIQAEPQISRVGETRSGSTSHRMTFLSIPVLATVYSVDNFSFEAGPKFSFLVDERQKTSSSGNDLAKTNRVKTLTFGLTAGASYAIDNNWVGQFRFNYTPSDIIKNNAGDTEGTSIVLFQLAIGYWLN
ncbi:porin family protein [Seonamhaeicola sp.]|uniref:porin family protein n=1 Tax=Seonamhaeicola sp. TaxID=1912245 RepID=UPI0026278958|nr:porin family protein [Seonamhaeicola sp.]